MSQLSDDRRPAHRGAGAVWFEGSPSGAGTPELIAGAVRIFADEVAAAGKKAGQKRGGLERQLNDIQRSLAGILKAIKDGVRSDTLRDRLAELESRKAKLETELRAAELPAPAAVLRPAAAEAYRNEVANLEAALNGPKIRHEAADVLRNLIDRVVLIPDLDAPGGLQAELHGAISEILALSERMTAPPQRVGGDKKARGAVARGR